MKVYFYDLECYPNCLLGVFIPFDTRQEDVDTYCQADIVEDKEKMAETLTRINPVVFLTMFDDERAVDQLAEMAMFMDNPEVIVIGFNNNEYDDTIINYNIIRLRRLSHGLNTIIMLRDIYALNNDIIAMGYNATKCDPIFRNYKPRYSTIDTFKSLYETINRKSLKQTMINLKWYNILDLPIAPGTHITWSMVEGLLYYCTNDVLGTRAFWFSQKDEINMKRRASMLYGISLINKNRSSIADALIQKMYMERTGLNYYQLKGLKTFRTSIVIADILDPRIEFNTPVFKAYHEKLKSTIFYIGEQKTLNANLPFKGNSYQFKKGGLHSKDMPGLYKRTTKYTYMDGDVTSYYPREVISRSIAPAHLHQPTFTAIGEFITNDRIEAKIRATLLSKESELTSEMQQEINDSNTIADVLKIVINSGIFGKFGYEKGWLYDLLALYKVTINCQLKLLKWVEILEEADFRVISVNTDGVTVKVEISRIDEYKELSINWGKLFGYNVEFNEYALYIRQNVNSYFAVYANGKIKKKGRFLTEVAIEKGYDKPIVAKALINYFKDNIPVMKTLTESTDIYDFCMSQKLGEAYNPEFHQLINKVSSILPLQKNIRYYVSKQGGRIMKRKGVKQISVLKRQVVLFNKYFPVTSILNYNFDYNYYHNEIMKIVNDIEHTSTKIMKKTSGTMFDDFE